MMQGFYLLAMQQARRRTLLAVLACLAAMISLVLAGRALLSAPAVPASAAISYTVQSENDRLVIRQSNGSVLRTGIDTRTLPSAEQQALADGITLDNAEELARLLENLLNNSVRHNPKPVNITVHTRQVGERFCLTVADDGIGYPAAVLAALNAVEPAENAPHILGLYVVRQIAAAHGGTAVFGQNTPHGAKAVVYLPLG